MDQYLQDLLQSGTPTGRMPLQGIDTPVRAPIPQQDPNSFAAPTRTKAAQNVLRTVLGLNDPGSFSSRVMDVLGQLQEVNDPRGAGPSKAIFLGTKGAQRLGGETYKRFLEGEAEANKGASHYDLWKNFRYAQDAYGQGRTEIPDPKGYLKDTDFLGSLRDIISHPTLFAAYPELEKIPSIIGRGEARGELYTTGWGPTRQSPASIRVHSDDLAARESILTHELQHAVQAYEGTPLFHYKELSNFPGVPPNILEELAKKLRKQGISSNLYSPYYRQVHEVEARNAAARQENPDLRAFYPAITEDISRNYQLHYPDPYTSFIEAAK